jgi:hypothetical protein
VRKAVSAVIAALAVTFGVGAPVASADLLPPHKATFYYPWYPETWTVGGKPVEYNPVLGKYSSDDLSVIDWHLHWLDYAGFEVVIASWFGPGTHSESSRIPTLLNRTIEQNRRFRWGLYYEPEGYGDPTTAQIQSHLNYASTYTSHLAFARINGQPLIFVFGDAGDDADPCEMAARWEPLDARYYIVLKVGQGFASCPNQPDDWHQYAPATRQHVHEPHSYAVSPGFKKVDESSARLKRQLNIFRTALRNMTASPARWHLVTTFNEWSEGSAIEPAVEFLNDPTCRPAGFTRCPGRYLQAVAVDGAVGPPPVTAAVAGDISAACSAGSPPANAMKTSDLLVGAGHAGVFAAGDNQYDGGLTNFQNCYDPTWGRVKTITFPSPGNHDSCPDSGYDEYFGARAPGCWYAFNIGFWRFISLDSNVPTNTNQLAFLVAELANSATRGCVGVFWHHPRFSSGEHGNDSDLDTIWRKLYNANVDLVINGHDHDYERFARQTPDAVRDDIHGIRELIVGTGGKSLRTFGTIKANSQVRFSDAFGVVKLTLLQHGYRSEWQSAAGEPTHTDVNTEDCH